jgi:hypothetical protein
MKFALRLQSGVAEVREAGAYRSDIRVSAGDVLGVTVSGGMVRYSRNGEVFYTSGTPVQYPLRVDTTIYEANGTISNAVLMTAAIAGQSAATTPAATSSSPSRATSSGSGSAAGNAVRRAIRRRGGVKSGS